MTLLNMEEEISYTGEEERLNKHRLYWMDN